MANTYRNVAGQNPEDVYDPDVVGDGPTAAISGIGYRTDAGVLLKFAKLSYGTAAPNHGYRLADGRDFSALWAKKGTASYALSIDGNSYGAGILVPSGGTGSITLRFALTSTTAWAVSVARAGGTGSPAAGNVDTGAVPTGATKVKYQLTYLAASGDTGTGVATNDATTDTVLATSLGASVSLSGSGTSGGKHSTYRLVITFTNAASAVISTTTVTFAVDQEGSA